MSALDAARTATRPTFDADACAAALDAALARVLPEPDIERAGREALAALLQSTGASRGSLMRVDPATACLTLVAGTGFPEHLLGQPLRPRPRSIAYWVYRKREGLLLQGHVNDPRFEASAGAGDIESSLCVSIMGSTGPVGVLSLARSGTSRPFTEDDLRALSLLMDRLGTALETLYRAELGRHCVRQIAELEGARSLARLAHGLTETRSWEFALAKRPGLRLGADRAERLVYPDGINALMLADVPGFAAGAAALSGFLHGLFTGCAAGERSARGLMERLNLELCGRPGSGTAAAMWAAFLTPRGEVRSCAAGYAPPLWVPADDSPVQRLERGGPLLGASREAAYEEETFRLLPGDLLVAVSDGVLDARDPTDTPFGSPALADLVSNHRRDPLDRLTGRILEAVLEHGRNTHAADDQLVFAIRYTPSR